MGVSAAITGIGRWLDRESHLGRDEVHLASTLRTICLTFLAANAVTIVLSHAVFSTPPTSAENVIMFSTFGLLLWTLALVRRARLRLTSLVLVGITWTATTSGLIGAGHLAAPAYSFYTVSIVAAGLLLGARAAIVVAAMSVGAGAAVGLAEARGLLDEHGISYGPFSIWWLETILFTTTAGLVFATVRRIRHSLSDVRQSEAALAHRNRELVHSLEEKLRAQETTALLQTAMDQAGEAIVVLDPDGTVRYSNAALETLAEGASRGQGDGARSAFFDAFGEVFRSQVLESLRSDGRWNGRIAPADVLLPVDARFSTVADESGAPICYAGVLRDVTREEELEVRLRQSEKLEALGQLAGGVAHDFNNLLVVIRSYADILSRKALGDLELEEAGDQIREAADQAAKLTGQLLAFGRRQVQRARVVDLNELVFDTARMLQRLVPVNVAIELELADDLGSVHVDPGHVHQILMNLVTNARDAMPSGGRVTLSTENDERELGDARSVLLRVRDDGEGMDADTCERIFEPFFTTKRAGQGTGLGLASVYGVVEQCRGRIEVQSRPGVGTEFRIWLPRSSAELAKRDPREAAPEDATSVARVLLVEDHDSVRRLMRRTLRAEGFEVIEASDGEDALARLEQDGRPVELVLTDVMMPKLDGPGLVTKLRERFPGVGVVYSSGYAPADLETPIHDDPLADFVQKPFSNTELIEKLRALLARVRGGAGGLAA